MKIIAILSMLIMSCDVDGMDLKRPGMSDAEYAKLLKDIDENIIPNTLKETGKFPNISLERALSFIRRTQSDDVAKKFEDTAKSVYKNFYETKGDEIESLLIENQQISQLINVYEDYGTTLLSQAVDHDWDYVVERMLIHRADVNARNYSGDTPLLYAIKKHSSIRIVTRLLKEANINVNIEDAEGLTGLDNAAKLGKEKIFELLLAHGAAITPKTLQIVVEMYLTKDSGQNLLMLLLDHGVDIGSIEKSVQSFDQNQQNKWGDFLTRYAKDRRSFNNLLAENVPQLPEDILSIVQEYQGKPKFTGPEKEWVEKILKIVSVDPLLKEKVLKNKNALSMRLAGMQRSNFEKIIKGLDYVVQGFTNVYDVRFNFKELPELLTILQERENAQTQLKQQSKPNQISINDIATRFNNTLQKRSNEKNSLLNIAIEDPMLLNRVPQLKSELNKIASEKAAAAA